VEAMNRTRVQFEELKTVLDAKDNLTSTLLEQNAALKKQVAEMSQQLHNLTSTKINLEGQLGKVKIDLDGLKMNTTRSVMTTCNALKIPS
jgi:phage regulator Rha-like protein